MLNSTNVDNLVAVSTMKYERDCYPTRVILWERNFDNSYITHLEVMPPDRQPFLVYGHYDMDEAGGMADFNDRCKSLGVVTRAYLKI